MNELEQQPILRESASMKMNYDSTYVYVPNGALDYEFPQDEMSDLDNGLGGKNTIRQAHVLKWGKEPPSFTDTHSLIRYSMSLKEMKLLEDSFLSLGFQVVYDVENIDFNNPIQVMILTKWQTQELKQLKSEVLDETILGL